MTVTDLGVVDARAAGRGPLFFARFGSHVVLRPNAPAITEGALTLSYGQLGEAVLTAAAKLRLLGVVPGVHVGILSRRSIPTVVAILAVMANGAAYVPLDRRAPSERLRSQLGDASLRAVIVNDDERALWATCFSDAVTDRDADQNAVVASGAVEQWTLTDALGGSFPPRSSRGRQHSDPTTHPSQQSSTLRRLQPLRREMAAWSALAGAVGPEALAYVIFTSGSTGRPKGVMISRENLDALLVAWDDVMGPVRHVSLLSSALSFDASVAELFWPLWAGGRLVVAPDERLDDEHSDRAGFSAFGAVLRSRRVTHMQCTPTRAVVMLADTDDRAALAGIDHLVIGGEAVPVPLARDLLAAGVRRLTNAYGPTEATVWATTREITLADIGCGAEDRPLSVGKPLHGVLVDIVDGEGRSIPDGERGELILGGALVASGYANRAELTAERFGYHPFDGSEPKKFCYRTGDVAFRKKDGSIVVLGRNDQQVKLRGHRIELGEIESALLAQSGVRLAYVSLLQRHGRDCLVAAVVASPECPSGPDDLKEALHHRLPDVMVPELIVVRRDFPTLSSGKVDRPAVHDELVFAVAQLDARVIASVLREDEYSAQEQASQALSGMGGQPRIERRTDVVLRAMVTDFAVVLGRGGVTPDSDFFRLGGHSLTAVELVARIEARTGQRLSIRSLLSAGTPRALVAWQANGPDRDDRVIVRLTERASSAGLRRPLFLIHGAGGNVLRFRQLARALVDSAQIIGVQALAIEGGIQDETLVAMVTRYADAIVEHDPSGVYELGGYSAGGIIALHVAGVLEQRGHLVRSLVLLDPLDSSELAVGMIDRAHVLAANLRPVNGITTSMRLAAAWEGWRRRREWDEEGAQALATIGYSDLFDHIVSLSRDSGSTPKVNAPALLVRSSVESPLRNRRYDRALASPRSVTVAWVRSKHDELLHDAAVPSVALAVESFLRSV